MPVAARLFLAQRVSAAALAVFVLIHVVTMIVAMRGGLTAAEILGRTRGSLVWGLFYGLFVLTVAIHGAIGLRTIAGEWGGLRGRARDAVGLAFAALCLVLGLRAVVAVTWA